MSRPLLLGGMMAVLLVLVLASGCSTPKRSTQGDGPSDRDPGELAQVPDAKPRDVPVSRYGNPEHYEVFGETYRTMERDEAEGFRQRGRASWYGTKFHGRRTSSGEAYDMYAMSAAHRELPLPSWVEVTNLDNDRRAVVKVNDRGPFVDPDERILDLSYAAAVRLGVDEHGTAPVAIRVVTPGEDQADDTAQADAAAQEAAGDGSSAGDAPDDDGAQSAPAEGRRPAESLDELFEAAALEATGDDATAADHGAVQVSAVAAVLEEAEAARGDPPAAGETAAAGTETDDEAETSSSGIYLQAGVYRERANAVEVRRLAEALEAEARIEQLEDEAGPLHRVRLGPLEGAAQAERLEQALQEAGIESYRLQP